MVKLLRKPGRRYGTAFVGGYFFAFIFLNLIIAILVVSPRGLYCQNKGFKYIRNYSPGDYNLEPQNWCVLQDKRGIIYAANQGGLLEFDGISWRKTEIPNISVRSLAMDESGVIYVGGNSEIGCLTPGPKGSLQYASLVHRLDEKEKNFSEVYRTHATKEGVYFNPLKFLIRRDAAGKQLKKWLPKLGPRFLISFTCGGIFFVDQQNAGLMRMEGDVLKPVPGGEFFAGKTIYMMAPYDDGRLLIGVKHQGFFIYDGSRAKPFPTEADAYLKANRFYRGIRLSSGDFALTTHRGGLVIIDARGKLKEIFNKDSGLQDDDVKYVFEDRQGNLWLALNEGISKIEYNSPFSIYDDRSGLEGLVLSVIKHGDDVYAGTTRGLYRLVKEKHTAPAYVLPGRFRHVLVPGLSADCRSLLSSGGSLLAAANDGVFQVKNNAGKAYEVIKDASHILLQSIKDKNRIWVGTSKGLSALYFNRETRRWQEEYKFKKVDQPVYTIVEDQRGNLWLGTLTNRVFKIDFFTPETISDHEVNRYGAEHGLPDGEINVFKAAGHMMFASRQGIFRFEKEQETFIPDFTFGEEFAGGPMGEGVYRIVEDKAKNTWFHSNRRNIKAVPQVGGTFTLERKPFLRFAGYQANAIYPEPGGNTVWFACSECLLAYDLKVKKDYDLDFHTFIRKVEINGNLIFYGYKYERDGSVADPVYTIDYKDRKNFHFELAASFFDAEPAVEYRTMLEGHDDRWSPYLSGNSKDFSSLDAGLYTFRVQAKNVYGTLGSEAVFSFRVAPPWHQTYWAFFIYTAVLSFLVFLLVRWRSGKLEREKQKLERIVKERTKEIQERTGEIKEKNQQLEEQTVKLKEQSEKLKEMDQIKSRFFANISHEFRTPLTLIMGPLEEMLSKVREKKDKKTLNLMLRNSQRLLGLINQLLELSKFESGKVKLQAAYLNIIPFLKGITAAFEAVADKNELDLTFRSEEENIELYFDAEKLEEVIFNLISNAVKFTPGGGRISVTAARGPGNKINFSSGGLEISVSDTGPGIPREQLAHIFDRFYQADSTHECHRKGSGIGLAIAKELVELHHGSIDVHSSVGKGTEFIARLPMGKEHLKPGEIVELPGPPPLRKSSGSIPLIYKKAQESVVPGEAETGQNNAAGVSTAAAEKSGPGGEEIDLLKPGREIILLIDDEADMRRYIRTALDPNYHVVEAKDGREGISRAQEIIPDLIISDVMMPGIDGYELCRQLKNNVNTSHIPVILLTARASEESVLNGLETGADDYITKPFNTRILCARIKNLIDLRRHMQHILNRETALQPVEIPVSKVDRKFIKKLQGVIDENISDPEFNIEQLRRKMEMSQPTLYRKIQAMTGESPTEFIRSYRLKRGAELLKNDFGTVLEVAFEVGFSSANYFTKCFKKKFHQLPTTYMAAE